MTRSQPPAALVGCLLFCSGCCALVFQVAWLRELRLVFGGSTSASAVVLAIFMGGLGLGNALFGRRVDKSANPLAFYGGLELFVGLLVVATPWLIDLLRAVYIGLGGQLALGTAGAAVVRLLLSCVVLGLPTVLMGGTLPAAVRAVATPSDVRRRNPALLYGMNTLGAVLGSLLSTFFLLEQFGTRRTLWLACAVNVLVGLYARRRARHVPAKIADSQPDVQKNQQGARAARGKPVTGKNAFRLPPWAVYASAGVVGFAFFLMELVWYRMLGPLLGGTTFTFGLILAVALLGIGIGGFLYWIASNWIRPSIYQLALSCGLESALIALPFFLGDELALLAGRLRGDEAHVGFGALVFGWVIVAAVVVFPASVASGFQFPLLIGLLGEGDRDVGKQVGLAFASNTLGAIVGSLVGGFGILPYLSAPGAWTAVVVILAALGLALVAAALFHDRSISAIVAPAGTVAIALALASAAGPSAVWRHSGIGVGRAQVPTGKNALQNWLNETRWQVQMGMEVEGVESSVAISVGDSLSFIVNGKSDGSAIHDAGTQIMVGMLGGILHPDPKLAMVIGLGTGESAGWLAECPTIERVDVVELEPAIDAMAALCASVNCHVLENTKVRRIYNDAREVLLATPDKYDLIASEPSNPYRAGVSSLYTREFYQGVRDRLQPGGLFLQWVQAYEISGETLASVCATLHSVFPYIEVWQTQTTDTLFVCSFEPVEYRAETLRQRIEQAPYKRALWNAWRIADLEGFLAHYLAGPAVVEHLAAQSGQWNTDDRNRIEYDFARSLGKGVVSIPDFRRQALELRAHRPAIADDRLSWQAVDDLQVLVYLVFESPPPLSPDATAAQRARGESYGHYLGGRMADALEVWKSHQLEIHAPLEATMLAHCQAASGNRDAAAALLPQVRASQPIEADMIQALLHHTQGDLDAATDSLEAAFLALRSEPWASRKITIVALDLALELAANDRARAKRLYTALDRPFAVLVSEERRLLTRLGISRSLEMRQIVESLSPLEPFPLWFPSILELRAECYATVGHPLADRAQRDWQTFQRNAREERAGD